jgi:hypothetical protein
MATYVGLDVQLMPKKFLVVGASMQHRQLETAVAWPQAKLDRH